VKTTSSDQNLPGITVTTISPLSNNQNKMNHGILVDLDLGYYLGYAIVIGDTEYDQEVGYLMSYGSD